jgi:hypothetical protein
VAREAWVHPPVVAAEPSSKALATWRYRALALVALALVVAAFVLLFLRFSDVTGGEDPGIGIGVSRLQAPPAAAAR